MGKSEETVHCVVLMCGRALDDVDALPDALHRRVAQPGGRVVVESDPCLAMAELCLADRINASRAAWGIEQDAGLTLVISPKTDTPELDHFVDAVRRHLPRVRIVNGVEDGTIGHPSPDSSSVPEYEQEDDFETSPRISAEELAMLFGHEGDEESER